MWKTILIVCSVVAAPGVAHGQATIPDELSLADALAIASARNPAFAAARNDVEIATAQRQETARRPNPALTFESEGYPLFSAQRPSFFDNQDLTFRFDQELETGGRRKLRLASADLGIEVARHRVANRLRQLELDVKRAYMQVVLAVADRTTAQTSLDEIDRVLTVTRARLKEGEIAGTDFRRLQVERLKFVDDVFAAELTLRNARSELLAQLGATNLAQAIVPTEALVPVAGTPATPSLTIAAALVTQALAARPDVVAARQEVERADTETRLQRALRAPSPTIGGGYRRSFGTNAVVFGVTLPLPLFNSLNAGSVERAEAERRRAANEAAATELAVRVDVQQAANALEINRQRVSYIEREYLTPARESRDIVAASFRLGATDLIDFLDAQRAFRDTTRTYNRALYEARVSAFALEAAVAAPRAAEPIR